MADYKTVISKYIEKANAEYQQNGRSDKFVAMEDRICGVDNVLHIYYFARYVKGVDVAKIQKVFCEKANLEQCFYFSKHVPGAEFKPFVEKVAYARDYFWGAKFAELATEIYLENFPNEQSPNKLGGQPFDIDKVYRSFDIEGLMHTYLPGLNVLHRYNKSGSDINHIIELAQREYEKHGRSENFVEIEKLALHALGNAEGNLFIRNVKGVSIKNFERVAMLRSNAFNTFMIAMHPKANKELMLKNLELTKLDYIEIDKELDEKNARRKAIKSSLEKTNDKREISRLTKLYNQISSVTEYVAQIDNDYITRIEFTINQQASTKNRG